MMAQLLKSILIGSIVCLLFSGEALPAQSCLPASGDASEYFLCVRQMFLSSAVPELDDFAKVNTFKCKNAFGPYSRLNSPQPAEIMPDSEFTQAFPGRAGDFFISAEKVQTPQGRYVPEWGEPLILNAGALTEKIGNETFNNANARTFRSFRLNREAGQMIVELNVVANLIIDDGVSKAPLYSGSYSPIAPPPPMESWNYTGLFTYGYQLCTAENASVFSYSNDTLMK